MKTDFDLTWYIAETEKLKEKWDSEVGKDNPISHYLSEILYELKDWDEDDSGVRVLVGDSFVKPSKELLNTFREIEQALGNDRKD